MVSLLNHSMLFLDRGRDRVWITLYLPGLYEQTAETSPDSQAACKQRLGTAGQTDLSVMMKLYSGVTSRRHLRKQVVLYKEYNKLLFRLIYSRTLSCTFLVKLVIFSTSL